MRKIFFVLPCVMLYSAAVIAQNVGINNANLTPDPSAGLDVNYTDKGVLIPRVSLTGTNDVTTIPGAATSLLVYNTATVSDVTPGFYYWDGSQWVRLLNTGNAGGMEWLLAGNAGTTAGTDFLGTTDAQDLVFKTNNTENMRISNTNGYIGIGTATPSTRLQLYNGDLSIKAGTITPNDPGDLIFIDNSGAQKARIWSETSTNTGLHMCGDGNITPDVTINTAGNVGVGTPTPTEKLDVNGNVQFSGELRPAGNSGTAGQVLTSQGAGNAPVWQTPSTSILLPVTYPYGTSAPNNSFSGSTGVTTIATFTAPSTGLYMVTASVTVDIVGGVYNNGDVRNDAHTYVELTGGGLTAGEEHLSEDATKQISLAQLFSLNAGDVVNFNIGQQRASTIGFSGLNMKVVKF